MDVKDFSQRAIYSAEIDKHTGPCVFEYRYTDNISTPAIQIKGSQPKVSVGCLLNAGDGYLALLPARGYRWIAETGSGSPDEVLSEGRRKVWVCELGRKAVDGPFASFVERIASARLEFGERSVVYESPSQGLLSFGWKGPLTQDGRVVDLGAYPRYDCPYVQAEFDPQEISIRCGGEQEKMSR